MKAQKVAIIDMGSNSVRFVIYDINNYACYEEILNLKVVARLSSHINDHGAMTPEGIEVVLNTLNKFEVVARKYNITSIRGVATAAIRNATNSKDIISAIHKHSSFSVEILSEEEEAYYGFLAVTNSTHLPKGITIDIGGGSTEVTYFEDRKAIHLHSFPFGALTLKKQFIETDSPSESEWAALRSYLQQQFSTLPWLKDKKAPVIGIGGSARNLGLIHQNIVNYPLSGLHQYEMTSEDVFSIQGKLSSLSLKEREKVDGLSKDRADIILPAIAAIEELIIYTGSTSFIVSNKGLRDGLFYEKLLETIDVSHFPNVTHESFYQLAVTYQLDSTYQKRLSVLSSYLATELINNKLITLSETDLTHLHWASHVFYIGNTIHPESKSQHTFYLLTNQSINGLTHMERLAIAFMASFRSRSQLKLYARPFRHWVTKEELKKYELMGALLKLCYGLNISKRDVVKRIQIDFHTETMIGLSIYYDGDPYFEEFHASKYKKHLERCLKRTISIKFIQN
ncbi:Ppx/GppA family phosphatase [Salipaludibacillus agaradhaerens]|uniref:Ppx/GppA family phosphatase n=1 Tax=Salipaludibacillus agaradhaerens TaxID=76935 RepID=UPI0021516BEE|nr:Ppx/GppA family phosphatase [Salipaludibacillus agaradhaerens]MCR6106344.1 Ppx/GppA family phosphatase [Salipaludibacillus agaradhaerens]MCR6118377.1 Ppx/GppA family phosphatase [Salipaludibacillus agaradhaerens]UJW57483.1 Ppx/GppA family phosphatase [Bacillus sp. A116_S68]